MTSGVTSLKNVKTTMASRLRKPALTRSLRVSLSWRPLMSEMPLVEARMKESAPCWKWSFFAGFRPVEVTMRPARLPVAVRTRCIRVRFS